MKLSRFSPLAFLLAAASVPSACAVTIINAVPYTISAPGDYRVGSNLTNANPSQNAITINASNVNLDLNGFVVSGPPRGSGMMTACILVNNAGNVFIQNGTLSSNGYGIYYGGAPDAVMNNRVENVVVTRCYMDGIRFGVDAAGSSVYNCTLTQIGNTSAFSATDTHAIFGFDGLRIERCTINSVRPAGNGLGYGIMVGPGSFCMNNTISNCGYPIWGGKYRDNLTANCSMPCSGGADAGGNN